MVVGMFSLQEDYWDRFSLQADDEEFLYNYLLEKEIPQTSQELVVALVEDRIRREILILEKRRVSGSEIFLPKESYQIGQELVFPALSWRRGKIIEKRAGNNPALPPFDVIKVDFNGGQREFATGLAEHILNEPPDMSGEESLLNADFVLEQYAEPLALTLDQSLESNQEFVRIAGRWFPRALLVDVNIGQLNLAEAVLDMEGGGPLPTRSLLQTVEMPADINQNLAEFSLDYALWKDSRFDEVGPAGEILWHLKRLEPAEVQDTPKFLRYHALEYDPEQLTDEMLDLEMSLDDELSLVPDYDAGDEVEITLIFPHWRVGSLPLSARMRGLFPTAYQTPRIRFILVDGETGEKFPGWVVREQRYVFGLRDFYKRKGVIPGSTIRVRKSDQPGEVLVTAVTHRPTREWIRTVLVGTDGGVVLAMLKQSIGSKFDDRMAIYVPELTSLDESWDKARKEHTPFEKVVVQKLRELSKLTPQGHVHASELYAAVNMTRRVPPGPLLTLLTSRPWFVHVGDMHFRLDEAER